MSKSRTAVPGSWVVTTQRPTFPSGWTTASPIRTSRPIQASSAYGVDAVDLEEHAEATGVERLDAAAAREVGDGRRGDDAHARLHAAVARRADLVRHDEPHVDPRPRRERRVPRPGDEATGRGPAEEDGLEGIAELERLR